MEKGFESIVLWLKEIFSNTWAMMAGSFASIIGYFLPVRDPIFLLLIFFVVDSIVGYLKNHKLRKEKFSKRKIFETTIPRMMAVVTFMMLLFSLDVTFKQDIVHTYMIVGYFIGGVLLFNIGRNFYELTRWKVFLNIGDMLSKNIETKTGYNIKETNKETEVKNVNQQRFKEQ